MLFRKDITVNARITLKPQINYVGKCKEVDPGVAQRVPGGLDSQISMTFGR